MTRIPLSKVPASGAHVVTVGDRRILLCRSAAGIHAMDDMCPHQLLSLEGARVRNNFILCPHHGARFSLEDGRSLSQITSNGLMLYTTRIVDEALEIDI